MSSTLQDITSGGVPYVMNLEQIISALKGTIDVSELAGFAQIAAPSTAVSAVASGSGVLSGEYDYKVAFVTGFWTVNNTDQLGTLIQSGNTSGGPAATVATSSNSVALSSIPIGPSGTVARIIYRTQSGGSTYYELVTLYNNTQETYTDNALDSSLGAQMPTTNTTGTVFSGTFVGDGSRLTNLPVSTNDATPNAVGVVEVSSLPSTAHPIVPLQADDAQEQSVGTSPTTIATFTPQADGNFIVWVYYRVITGTTNVTVEVTYTDKTGAQTNKVLDAQSSTVGSYSCLPVFVNAVSGTAIDVNLTASVTGQVYSSADIQAA